MGLSLVAGLVTTVPFGKIIEQQERVEAARAELSRLEAENGFLLGEVAAMATPGEIERMAREKLGYVMPGEVAYVVLDPDVTTTSVVEAAPLMVESPWWQTLWNFLTGADGGG